MEKVSIIVPLYNNEKYVARCLESVINQTYKNWELIIVNDGSTDHSCSIVHEYTREYNSIILINQKNKGASAARNTGLSHATGSYIQFLDADDCIDSKKIEEQMNMVDSFDYPIDIVFSASWKSIRNETISEVSSNQQTIWHNYETPIEILCDFPIVQCCFPPGVFLLPRKLINDAGGWDESLSLNDDGEFMARIYSKAKKIIFCEKSVFYYRSTPNSLSKRMSKQAAISQMNSLVSIAEILNESSNPSKREAVFQYIANSLRSFYPYYKDARIIGEDYLKENRYDISLVLYPKLNIKEYIYYLLNWQMH